MQALFTAPSNTAPWSSPLRSLTASAVEAELCRLRARHIVHTVLDSARYGTAVAACLRHPAESLPSVANVAVEPLARCVEVGPTTPLAPPSPCRPPSKAAERWVATTPPRTPHHLPISMVAAITVVSSLLPCLYMRLFLRPYLWLHLPHKASRL